MWSRLLGIGLVALAALAERPPENYGNLPVMEGWYRGEPVQFRVYKGYGLIQGDMLLGPVEALVQPPKDAARASLAYAAERFRWTGRVIPYEIDPALPNPQRITEAVQEWNDKTVIRLKPREGEANFVRFVRATSGCNAFIGMIGGSQAINLADACTRGNTIHEIGHAVGLFHTQSRADRASYLAVLFENVQRPLWDQFARVASGTEEVGPYDYGSIMHYSQFGSNSTPRSAMQTLPAGIPVGQRTALSQAEIQSVAKLYGEPIREVVIDTYPPGLPVVVDGQSYRAPKAFAWNPGETHILQASARIATTSANAEFRFARWSDEGAAEHTITVTAGNTLYIANYAQYLRLRTGVAPEGAGTAEVSPPSEDGFYPTGALVKIRATANEGARFFRWTQGPGGATSLAANEQGNGANPAELSIRTDNAFYVANFLDRDFTAITATSPGAVVTVDGQTVYTPVHLDWAPGSTHTVSVDATRTLSDSGIRYLFRGWSNEGERQQSLAVTAPVQLTANVVRQFRIDRQLFSTLPVGTAPPTLQNLTLSPEGDGWYDDGAAVEARVTEPAGVPFSNWTFDMGGRANPQTFTVASSSLLGANFMGAPSLNAFSAVNDGSQRALEISPGLLFTVYTPGIGGDAAVDGQPDAQGAYPRELSGVAVVVGNERAGIVRLAKGAVTALAPASLPAGRLLAVGVESDGRRRVVNVSTQAAAPGIYTVDGSGRGNASAAPAVRGGMAGLTVTGMAPALPATVEVDGLAAESVAVTAAGPGRFTVEFRVPWEAPVGPAIPVVVASGGARSQVTATLEIQ